VRREGQRGIDVLLVCSEDKCMSAFDLGTNEKRAKGNISQSYLTSVAYDPISQLAYFGNLACGINVVDIVDPVPRLVEALAGHKGAVHSLCFHASSPEQGLLYSGSYDTTVGVWAVSRPPPRSIHPVEGKRIASLAGGATAKAQSVVCMPAIGAVAVGYANGHIGIFASESTQLWHVLPGAHYGAVVQLLWVDAARVLVSAGDAMSSSSPAIRFWQFSNYGLEIEEEEVKEVVSEDAYASAIALDVDSL